MCVTGDGFGSLRRGVVLQVQRVRASAGHGRPGQAAPGLGHQGRLPHVPGHATALHLNIYKTLTYPAHKNYLLSCLSVKQIRFE